MKRLETCKGQSGEALSQTVDRNFDRLNRDEQGYAVTGNYIFRDEDEVYSLQVNATVGNLIASLPSPTGNRRRRVIKTDSSGNTVTVAVSTTGQLINGGISVILTYQYEFVTVEPTGTGWLIISRGTLTPSFNSIAFPSTQVPSADPNTLDDYEEGTWTPVIGGTATYTSQNGRYTKIGRLVTLQLNLVINVRGTGSQSVISGLPFAAVSIGGFAIYVSYWSSAASSFVNIGGYLNGSVINLTGLTAASTSVTDPALVFQNGTQLILSAEYNV